MDFLSLWHQIAPWACVLILGAGLGALSWIDFRTGFLPFAIQIPLGVLGLGVAVLGSPVGVTWPSALAGAAVNAGLFWALRWLMTRWKGREAMGEGDVWLVGVGGLWLGPVAIAYISVIGAGGTLIAVGLASLVRRKKLWEGEMPLGPGLAVGILGCFLFALYGPDWLHVAG